MWEVILIDPEHDPVVTVIGQFWDIHDATSWLKGFEADAFVPYDPHPTEPMYAIRRGRDPKEG